MLTEIFMNSLGLSKARLKRATVVAYLPLGFINASM